MLWDEDDRFKDWTSDDWLDKFCYPLLRSCQILVVCPNHKNSYGVKKEIEFAETIGMPVIFYKNERQLCEEVGKVLEDFFSYEIF